MSAITLDVLVSTLWSTLLHPVLCFVPAVTLTARDGSTASTTFHLLTLYAAAVLLLRSLLFFDSLYAARRKRPIEWSTEVVVVAGGNGGLGSLLAEMYGQRGVSTAVLDVAPAVPALVQSWEGRGCAYHACDVADEAQVARAVQKITDEFEAAPTIVINAAAVVAPGPLLQLSSTYLTRALHINVLGAHHLVRACLPGMLARRQGGTIVNVSSVLGGLGAAGLGAYTASKAALTALHTSLRAELDMMQDAEKHPGLRNVRMVLSRPGQLGTAMFADVRPPNEFVGPTVTSAELAGALARAIDAGVEAHVDLPLYARMIGWMHVLPLGMQRLARRVSGVDRAGWDAFRDR